MISEGNNPVQSPIESGIDASLRVLGSSPPPTGLEGRILTRLAAERLHQECAPARRFWLVSLQQRMPKRTAPALGFASAGLVCVILVAGSVRYSHRPHAEPVAVPAPLQMPSQGLGAASAEHPAAPASNPVAAAPTSRGRSARHTKHGRARVGRHAKTPEGVIVPVPSAAPQN
jgi:hypothetical protein